MCKPRPEHEGTVTTERSSDPPPRCPVCGMRQDPPDRVLCAVCGEPVLRWGWAP